MAEKRIIKIDLGMTRLDYSKRETKAELVLETSKGYRGGVRSDAQVGWVGEGFRTVALGLGGGGDFSKTLATAPGVCTQKAIDRLHAATFTQEAIQAITAEAKAYYERKEDAA